MFARNGCSIVALDFSIDEGARGVEFVSSEFELENGYVDAINALGLKDSWSVRSCETRRYERTHLFKCRECKLDEKCGVDRERQSVVCDANVETVGIRFFAARICGNIVTIAAMKIAAHDRVRVVAARNARCL